VGPAVQSPSGPILEVACWSWHRLCQQNQQQRSASCKSAKCIIIHENCISCLLICEWQYWIAYLISLAEHHIKTRTLTAFFCVNWFWIITGAMPLLEAYALTYLLLQSACIKYIVLMYEKIINWQSNQIHVICGCRKHSVPWCEEIIYLLCFGKIREPPNIMMQWSTFSLHTHISGNLSFPLIQNTHLLKIFRYFSLPLQANDGMSLNRPS
jgi:hypothetical protein